MSLVSLRSLRSLRIIPKFPTLPTLPNFTFPIAPITPIGPILSHCTFPLCFLITPIIPIILIILKFPITPINNNREIYRISLGCIILNFEFCILNCIAFSQPPPTHPLNCLKKCKKIFKNPFFVSIFVVQSGQNLFSSAV